MSSSMPLQSPSETKGVRPVLLEGERVQVTGGPFGGRMAVVTGHDFASDKDYLQFHTAGHPKRMFAKVAMYRLITRDSRNERITVAPEDLEPLSVIGGWGRGAAPEEAPGGEGFEAKRAKEELEAKEIGNEE